MNGDQQLRSRIAIVGVVAAVVLGTASAAWSCVAIGGLTFLQDGKTEAGVPGGARVTAYAVGADPQITYQLVAAQTRGGSGDYYACLYPEAVIINLTHRVPTDQGLIPRTTGQLPDMAGLWHVCFAQVRPTQLWQTRPVLVTIV